MAQNSKSKQFEKIDLEKLSNNIKAAAKGNVSFKLQTRDLPPAIGRIHDAVEGGHITVEEGMDLNPNYNPENRKKNQMASSNIRQYEKNLDVTRKKLRENAAKRAAGIPRTGKGGRPVKSKKSEEDKK
jgi:hypothetical protein